MFVHIRDNTNQVSCKLQFINVLIFVAHCVKTFKILVEYVTDHDTLQNIPQAQIYSTFDFGDGS